MHMHLKHARSSMHAFSRRSKRDQNNTLPPLPRLPNKGIRGVRLLCLFRIYSKKQTFVFRCKFRLNLIASFWFSLQWSLSCYLFSSFAAFQASVRLFLVQQPSIVRLSKQQDQNLSRRTSCSVETSSFFVVPSL